MKFNRGDYVIVTRKVAWVTPAWDYYTGYVYKVARVSPNEQVLYTTLDNKGSKYNGWSATCFENLGPTLTRLERVIFKVIE